MQKKRESRESNYMKCLRCIIARLMKSSIFQKGFQLLYNAHACGTVGMLLEAAQFSWLRWGGRETQLQLKPCTGGDKKGKARIAQGWSSVPDQPGKAGWCLLPPRRQTVS